MKIDNVKVYDLEESIIASGLPMMAEYEEKKFKEEVANLASRNDIIDNPHYKRACQLAANPAGSGHNNFLSGIVVSMNVTATNVWWMQMERYHFVQIVSSQSKMHRLLEMLKTQNLNAFHPGTAGYVVGDYIVVASKKETATEELVYSCPMGLELTARITTNYLQLKTIWNQRHEHKLKEWRDFCDNIYCLPFATDLIIPNNKKGN
jgi:hypothetical protein